MRVRSSSGRAVLQEKAITIKSRCMNGPIQPTGEYHNEAKGDQICGALPWKKHLFRG